MANKKPSTKSVSKNKSTKVKKTKVKKNKQQKEKNKFSFKKLMKNKTLFFGGIAIIVILLIAVIFLVSKDIKEAKERAAEEAEEARIAALPPKIDISMKSYYGYVDYILEYFDLDFDLVTSGVNCYTGARTSTYDTEKYGVLHVEFSYCSYNKSEYLRVYNSSEDQELRDANPGEIMTFDSYGLPTSSGASA